MVPALSPLMLLLNAPVPRPSVVLVDRATVGPEERLQTTPRTLTDAPPSAVTSPPLVAVVEVMPLMLVVLTVGRVATLPVVVKVVCVPYAVPSALVA